MLFASYDHFCDALICLRNLRCALDAWKEEFLLPANSLRPLMCACILKIRAVLQAALVNALIVHRVPLGSNDRRLRNARNVLRIGCVRRVDNNHALIEEKGCCVAAPVEIVSVCYVTTSRTVFHFSPVAPVTNKVDVPKYSCHPGQFCVGRCRNRRVDPAIPRALVPCRMLLFHRVA